MQLSISFLVAVFAATVCASPVEKGNGGKKVATKAFAGDDSFYGGGGDGLFPGSNSPFDSPVYGGGQSGFGGPGFPGGSVGGGSFAGSSVQSFEQIYYQFSSFQQSCGTIIQTCQQSDFQVAISSFSSFCQRFEYISRSVTSIQSWSSIQGSSYQHQFQGLFIQYTRFTYQLITIFQQRWGSQVSAWQPYVQRYCTEYQRVIGLAVHLGIDVQSCFAGLHIDLSIFASVGLHLGSLLNLDADVLINADGLLGLGHGPLLGGGQGLVGGLL